MLPLYGLLCLVFGVVMGEIAARLGVSRVVVLAAFLAAFVVEAAASYLRPR